MMRLPLWALLLAGLLAVPSGAVAIGPEDNTLRFAFQREIENIDAYFNNVREGVAMQHHIWDRLLYRDLETGEYQPMMAQSYEWIDDTTLEMELREGIVFHNGQPFTADDVVYTLNFVSDPGSGVVTPANVMWIDEVEKLDDYRIRIHLHEPFPAALEYLAMAVPIYPHEHYREVGPDGMGRDPIGSGPYRVVEIDPGRSVRLELFEDYFADSPRPEAQIGNLHMRTIPDMSTQVAELMAGNIDWIWYVPPEQADRLAAVPDVEVVGGETMRIRYLGFDAAGRTGDNPFTDRRVRQAVAHAVDRQTMVERLVGGDARVVHAACFPDQFGCVEDAVPQYEYDPDKARELLEEAGYPDGFTIDLYAYRERELTEATIGYLREVGINANLRWMEFAALRDRQRADGTEFYDMAWGSFSINDVSAITGHFFGGGPDDYAQDSEVIEWLQIADTSVDPELRLENYERALTRIAEEIYWLPMFSYVTFYAHTDQLEFTPTPDEVPRFYTARWK
jgi:peptide/nickel transport system substrate-binding protein